jgi:hypothetical protein
MTLAFVVLGGPSACAMPGAFECQSDDQCHHGSRSGRCESSGWCSFPDTTCESGYKFGAHAGDGLAGACVDEPLGSSGGSTGPATTLTTTTTTTTTTLDDTGPLTTTADGSTTVPLTSGPSESSSSAASEDTGEPVDPAVFFDDFERPNDPMLGNGWVEKTATAYQIVDGRVVFESSAGGYQDNLWYRDESVLDVEVCVEVELLAIHPDNHPQVHARMQPGDIAEPGQVTSYILYVEGPQLRLVRVAGGGFGQVWSEPLTAELAAGPSYRLCIIVRGTDPVELEGRLWVQGGGGWALHTEVLATDGSNGRIAEPGATGSSGADSPQLQNFAYDNFMRTILTP